MKFENLAKNAYFDFTVDDCIVATSPAVDASDDFIRTQRRTSQKKARESMTGEFKTLRKQLEGEFRTAMGMETPNAKVKGRAGSGDASESSTMTTSSREDRTLAERCRHRDAPFDIYPLREADLGDLDENLFREAYLPAAVSPAVLAENNRTAPEQMASLRLVELGPPPVPTVLGLLTIGKQPTRHLPMAYVSFVRVEGLELASEVISRTKSKAHCPGSCPRSTNCSACTS